MPETKPRTRKSAEERREEIVGIAIRQFALSGYNGTSTEAIAREAGISQPYLFRLFKTKRELFLACFEVVHERIRATFVEGASGVPKDAALERMGKAYIALLEDTNVRLFQMQAYAACSDPVIQARVRDCYGVLVQARHPPVGRAAGGDLAVLLPRDAPQRDRVARPRRDRRQGAVGKRLAALTRFFRRLAE